ncbi:glycosyltransferase family 2 protein [Tateyamaria omphalii]|uniref:Glycosyl transferase family 2 n=1 Tax=Tateyamaria omphalii TaxID=299262 RepID=A0A1P8N1Z5_9RHOB|nr:glycosyltransferase family A protein [Tateyamaria omphalii]APX14337.1 glycosyl transferase family 2 [Tateyamaria omphalii]
MTYILISPCKNEGDYIEKTLISIRNQTVPPAQWIIVDDGSTDNSVDIIEKYLPSMPYIKVVNRPKGERRVGGGVIEAFNTGLAAVDVADYEYLCKLDVDLDLPPRYFEILLDRMAADPRLGTASGKAYYMHPTTNERKSELCGDEASVGMTKFYRRACFEEIGGFVAEVGWDGYDCHRARWFGWRAISWNDPDLQFIHLRPMGSSQKSIYRGRIRHGKGQFHLGAHPLFFMLSSLYRSVRQRPYVTGTLFSIYGYMKAWLQGEERFGDQDMTAFIRAYQLRALRSGKAEAAEWALQQRRDVLGV